MSDISIFATIYFSFSVALLAVHPATRVIFKIKPLVGNIMIGAMALVQLLQYLLFVEVLEWHTFYQVSGVIGIILMGWSFFTLYKNPLLPEMEAVIEGALKGAYPKLFKF